MNWKDRFENEYFEWLFKLVCENRYSEKISYRKLLMHLHDVAFRYSIPRDQNREEDGIDLRHKFIMANGYADSYELVMSHLEGDCSVLEMMVALATRCEQTIMDDPGVGNRESQWFWNMVTSLDLGSMSDDRYDKQYVEDCINRFLDREYSPNGRGGLFTVRGCMQDLRTVEIWYQLCWYLDSIV